jgi:antagonist of KipI
MSTLVVESPGLLTTVQDLGRPGFGAMGVSPSGAADPVSLRLGNLLVGNEPTAAGLEMALVGGSFVFPEGAIIALTGANFVATIDGCPAQRWTVHLIPPQGKLKFAATQDFARGYLAIARGIQVPLVLGSASTHLLSGLGGYQGRALRKGDVLQIGKAKRKVPARKIAESVLSILQPSTILRVTDGPQSDLFSETVKQTFFRSAFRVTEECDRTGLRLKGPGVECNLSGEMITEGVPLGAVQVTPSGQAIILFVEQQTTGGYPKIANVIGVDLHRLGQLRPRMDIRFERTSLAVARALWIEQERLLNSPRRLFA